ncbi:NYN domain-containing protein [Coriobacteriia bacterium Es71-Z0120]|nr:NYN domain-containing protein [Parvivirga hydrogeniphila]
MARSDPATKPLADEEQRAALVRRLAVRGEALLGTSTIVVVFDGCPDGMAESVGSVEVRFSRDRIADDLVAALAGPDAVVVTSDHELADRCRAAGARVQPASTVFESARPARRRKSARYPASTVGIPKGGNLITEELKRMLLDEEGGSQESGE